MKPNSDPNLVQENNISEHSQDRQLSENEMDCSRCKSATDETACKISPHALSENITFEILNSGQSARYKRVNVAISNMLDNL